MQISDYKQGKKPQIVLSVDRWAFGTNMNNLKNSDPYVFFRIFAYQPDQGIGSG
jgi:hypothetical protein